MQSCHKGAPNGPLAVWKAKATVADPTTNAKLKMTFFGGVVSQDYGCSTTGPTRAGWSWPPPTASTCG